MKRQIGKRNLQRSVSAICRHLKYDVIDKTESMERDVPNTQESKKARVSTIP